MTGALQALRDELHARAYDHHSHGRTEAAQALWSVVESLDTILTGEAGGTTIVVGLADGDVLHDYADVRNTLAADEDHVTLADGHGTGVNRAVWKQ